MDTETAKECVIFSLIGFVKKRSNIIKKKEINYTKHAYKNLKKDSIPEKHCINENCKYFLKIIKKNKYTKAKDYRQLDIRES